MAPVSKSDAQRRADQIAAFRAELDRLAGEGIARPEPAWRAAVDAHHAALLQRLSRDFDIDRTATEKRMSAGMRIASLLGAAALVAAIVSFFYRIWGSLDAPVQVTLVTLAPIAAAAVMLVAARVESTRYVASIFAAVACAAIVLQTVLLGGLFNLRGSPHPLLAWSTFAFAVAIPWRFVLPFAWGVAALAGYGAALLISFAGARWSFAFERPESLLVPSIVLFAAMRWAPRELAPWGRGTALLLTLGPILFLSAIEPISLLPVSRRLAQAIYQGAAVLAALITIAGGLRRSMPEVVQIGTLFAGAFLLTRFADWWWDWMPKYLFFLIIAALAIGWLWALRLLRRRLGVVAA